jgi:hypothetical protein
MTTGIDVIRAATRNRARGNGLARLASDLHLSLTQLDLFAYHNGALAPEALRLLATDLFAGHAEYDPVVDLLRPVNRTPAIPGGISPEPFKRVPLSDVVPPRVPPKATAQAQPARARRAGWAE